MPALEADPVKVIAVRVCIHLSDRKANLKPENASILCPGVSASKTVASICTQSFIR